MLSYILRRTMAVFPVLGLVALIVFGLLYLAPGDPAAVLAGDMATTDDLDRLRQSLGLDEPFPVRFLAWLAAVTTGDLGTSIFTKLPVTTMIAQRMEPTISLMLYTMIIAISVSVPLGVLAAWKRETWVDYTVMGGAVLAFSTPVFVVGYLVAYTLGLKLGWLPVQGYSPIANGFGAYVRSLTLPAIALGLTFTGLLARTTRAAMLDVLSEDYIRTARAKGMGRMTILFVHALRNASPPIITVAGVGVALLIGGAVVTESVFAIPGLGRMTVEAILRRDYPVIQGVVLFFSVVYVLVNLVVDILYRVVDPRISY